MPATWAAVSAVASIAGGIFGASSASKQNKEAKKLRKHSKKLLTNKLKLPTSIIKQRLKPSIKITLLLVSFSIQLLLNSGSMIPMFKTTVMYKM